MIPKVCRVFARTSDFSHSLRFPCPLERFVPCLRRGGLLLILYRIFCPFVFFRTAPSFFSIPGYPLSPYTLSSSPDTLSSSPVRRAFAAVTSYAFSAVASRSWTIPLSRAAPVCALVPNRKFRAFFAECALRIQGLLLILRGRRCVNDCGIRNCSLSSGFFLPSEACSVPQQISVPADDSFPGQDGNVPKSLRPEFDFLRIHDRRRRRRGSGLPHSLSPHPKDYTDSTSTTDVNGSSAPAPAACSRVSRHISFTEQLFF